MKHVLPLLQGRSSASRTTCTLRAGGSDSWGNGVRWGDPVLPDAPAFDAAHQTRAAQEKQFGYNGDHATLMPLRRGPLGQERGLLIVDHKGADEILAIHGGADAATATVEQLGVGLAATGLTVVEIERIGRTDHWGLVTAGHRPFNRRVTGTTPLVLSGPAAGHRLLRTAADPTGRRVLGTLETRGGGGTPWGTTLHGEGDVDRYFEAGEVVDPGYAAVFEPYGLPLRPAGGRGWSRLHERFDLSRHPHEAHRFGWVVELDPYDPDATPRKRTMLGRFAHAAPTVAIGADGRAVVDLGVDGHAGYRYRFVSRDRHRRNWSASAHRHNMSLLDHGTLYVAPHRDGTDGGTAYGEAATVWTPLTTDAASCVPGMSVAEVLVTTRLAADRLDQAARLRTAALA